MKSLVVITAGFAEAGAEGGRCSSSSSRRSAATACGWSVPTAWASQHEPGVSAQCVVFADHCRRAGRDRRCRRRAARSGLAILRWPPNAASDCRPFVSVGNKADVSGNDLLRVLGRTIRSTHVILLYLESFGNPRRFARLARRIGRTKPIVAVKAGRTRAGSRAAGSHTAALAASDTAVDALFHQSGVIRADTIDEMFDIAALSRRPATAAGRRVAIVTNAGGPGILAVDACEAAGPDRRRRFRPRRCAQAGGRFCRRRRASAIRSIWSRRRARQNTGRPSKWCWRRRKPTRCSSSSPRSTRAAPTRSLAAIRDGMCAGAHAGATGKPVLACVMAEARRRRLRSSRRRRTICRPIAFPENAVRALAKVAAYAEWRAQPPALFWGFDDVRSDEAHAPSAVQPLAARGDGWLTDRGRATRCCSAFGLPLAAGAVAHTADEAAALAAVFGLSGGGEAGSRRACCTRPTSAPCA